MRLHQHLLASMYRGQSMENELRTGARYQLEKKGFVTFSHVLSAEMLQQAKDTTSRLIAAQPRKHFAARKSTGSMISVFDDSFFADLVGWTPALTTLAELGIADPRFTSGYVISKPPHSPPLFWHQDWGGWDDPLSYTEPTLQIFLMYYLVDTSPANGCLRVLSGSHRRRHAMHDAVPEAHAEEISKATDPTHLAFQPIPEDEAVPVRAGDLVIGDSRLLHGAYANDSDEWRTVITLWFHPFERYSGPLKAYMAQSMNGTQGWPASIQAKIKQLIPAYAGRATPVEWNRKPGPGLK